MSRAEIYELLFLAGRREADANAMIASHPNQPLTEAEASQVRQHIACATSYRLAALDLATQPLKAEK